MGLLRNYFRERNKLKLSKNQDLTTSLIVSLVLCCAFLSKGVHSSLPLTKPCGDDGVCQALEYCRQIDHICQPCKDVCDPASNNFDEDRCVSDCQDLIHDERYIRLQNSTLVDLQQQEEKYKALEKDVLILKIAVGICVAIIITVVVSLMLFFAYFYKLMHPSQPGDLEAKKKAAANKSSSVELPTVYNNRYGVTTPTPEMSPSSVISSSPADTNLTLNTTSTTVPPYHSSPPMTQMMRSSPSKSESSVATPRTATTILMSSATSTLINNGGPHHGNKFRREPSESTLPENCAYDNLSMSPQHNNYSHHV